MSLYILTNENLADTKAGLRAFLPDVRSAHLTEAIAAGLGFRTHATLLANLAADAGRPAAIAEACGQHFTRRLVALGYVGNCEEAFAAATSAPLLADLPYAFFRQGDRAANDRHYHDCQRRNRPMIMVKMARKYAELEWDCITIQPDQEDYLYGTDKGRSFMHVLFAGFQARAKGAPGKPYFVGGAFTGRIERLLPETARLLAEDYFRMLYLPLRDPEGPGLHQDALTS